MLPAGAYAGKQRKTGRKGEEKIEKEEVRGWFELEEEGGTEWLEAGKRD